MATWTTIQNGMSDGGTAIQAALVAINKDVEANTSATTQKVVKFTQSDVIDSAGVTEGQGTLTRIGNLVLFAFYGTAGAPKSGNDVQSLVAIPNGFKPGGFYGQWPISWSQSATVTTQRAYIDGADFVAKWRMAQGHAYVAGAWTTNDDMPD